MKLKIKKIIAWLFNNKAILLVIILASAVRFIGIVPNFLHPDEGYVQLRTWELLANIIEDGNFNPNSFKYGTIIFYLQAIAYSPILITNYLVHIVNVAVSSSFASSPLPYGEFQSEAVRKLDASLLFAGRAQTAFFGVLSVGVLYAIAKRLFNKNIALISAILFAIAPLHVRDSRYITTDILSVFSTLLALYFLVRIFEEKKIKWFILAGITIGISSTIRFFPVSFLLLPLLPIFSFKNRKISFRPLIITGISILIGLFLGLPFLFLDPSGPHKLMEDLQRYALPWYGTSISTYVFSLGSYISSQGTDTLPPLSSTYPQFFRPFYSSLLFFTGFGVMPTLLSILGIIMLFRKSLKIFFLLILIPAFTFIYSSSYIPSSYERVIIPVIPFLSIFAAIAIDKIFSSNFFTNKTILKFLALLLIFAHPGIHSIASSYACSQDMVQKQSANWVDQNVSTQAKTSYLTMVSFPSYKTYAGYYTLEPDRELSLEEAKNLGADHAFINASRLDYHTYTYFNKFFIPPADIYENSYYPLTIHEYQTRAETLNEIVKPIMCDSARIYYFKMRDSLPEANKLVKKIDFNSKETSESWDIQNYNFESGGEAHIVPNGIKKTQALEFKQFSANYTSPRLRINQYKVEKGKIYKFTSKIRSNDSLTPRVLLRADFYADNNEISKTTSFLNDKISLLTYGSTPTYFEQMRKSVPNYTDINLPGFYTALSPRVKLSEEWKDVSVTTLSPDQADFVVISIQNYSTEEMDILIDDIEISTN